MAFLLKTCSSRLSLDDFLAVQNVDSTWKSVQGTAVADELTVQAIDAMGESVNSAFFFAIDDGVDACGLVQGYTIKENVGWFGRVAGSSSWCEPYAEASQASCSFSRKIHLTIGEEVAARQVAATRYDFFFFRDGPFAVIILVLVCSIILCACSEGSGKCSEGCHGAVATDERCS